MEEQGNYSGNNIRLAAAGDVYVDVYSDGRRYPGGNCLNVAVHMKALGADVKFCGAVGTDDNAAFALGQMRKKGIETDHVKVLEGATAATKVELIAGERRFLEYPLGVMEDFRLTKEDIAHLSDCRIVHSAMWGCIHSQLWELREAGLRVSFDFSDIYEGAITEIAIKNCDYAFFSYAGEDDEFIRDFITTMHSRGPKIVFATFGERGSLAYDGNYFTKCGIFPAQTVDSLGAGDSYIAGVLTGLARGLETGGAMLLGAKVASGVIQRFGAW
ncbi:MAG: fructoselysine 6-kinase [Eubacteriaceae bacterium]|nr:fructoselysine 6-kinase [Eubacteriaceae bacterium]